MYEWRIGFSRAGVHGPSGPGHQSIFQVGSRSFVSFHAWEATSSCHKLDDNRYLYVAPIFWKDGKPQIGQSLRETVSSK